MLFARLARSCRVQRVSLSAPAVPVPAVPALHPVPAVACRLSTTAPAALKRTQMPSRPAPPPEHEIEEAYVKGSGPGGQKINKTNSAVQLRHIPTGLVVKSQATRSRSQNRQIARNLLALRLDELANGTASRTAVVGAHKAKKRLNADKKARRKYKKLAEAKAGEAGETGDPEDPEDPEEGADDIDGRPKTVHPAETEAKTEAAETAETTETAETAETAEAAETTAKPSTKQ